MNKVIPADAIPGVQLTAEQQIKLHNLFCDLSATGASQQEVDVAMYAFASEMLANQSDNEASPRLGTLLWHLRMAWPAIVHANLSAASLAKLRSVITDLLEKGASFDTANAVLQHQVTQCLADQQAQAELIAAEPSSIPAPAP